MSSLTRKEREKAEHKRGILLAAEEVFGAHGYYSATVQQIADRAEFSVGYLYSLFASKEELYTELLDMRISQYMDEFEEVLARANGALEKLRAAIRMKFDFFNRHRRFFSIFSHLHTGEGEGDSIWLPAPCWRRYREFVARMAKVFAAGIEEGVFADEDPVTLVLCAEGVTGGVIDYWLHAGHDATDEKAPEVVERVLLRGILAEGRDDERA